MARWQCEIQKARGRGHAVRTRLYQLPSPSAAAKDKLLPLSERLSGQSHPLNWPTHLNSVREEVVLG